MPKRAPRATPEQFKVMVNFMTEHSCLVHPKLSNSLPSTERDQLWEGLCDKLNNQAFGPKKTTFQWRRVWTDLKSEVKDKLAEINKCGLRGRTKELLNPCHNKVAKLLAKASSQCAFVERQGLSVSSLDDVDKQAGIKYEESIHLQHSEQESSTVQPFVVSLRAQPPESDSRRLVKCEEITENDSSDPEVLATYALSVNSNEENQNLEDTINSTMAASHRTKQKTKRKKIHKPVTEETHLSNLVKAEKEKSKMLGAIAEAISQSNEHSKEALKIKEERNRLIEQRNSIESARNDIFKSFLEHMISKGSL